MIFWYEFSALLLLRHTNGASTTAGCLGVLTTDTETPVVTHTTMGTDLLQTLQIFTQFRVQIGGGQLLVFAINDILLSVQEPVWDLVLAWVRDDGDNFVNLQCEKEHTHKMYEHNVCCYLRLRSVACVYMGDMTVAPPRAHTTEIQKQLDLRTSSSVHSPARLVKSTSAFLRTMLA